MLWGKYLLDSTCKNVLSSPKVKPLQNIVFILNMETEVGKQKWDVWCSCIFFLISSLPFFKFRSSSLQLCDYCPMRSHMTQMCRFLWFYKSTENYLHLFKRKTMTWKVWNQYEATITDIRLERIILKGSIYPDPKRTHWPFSLVSNHAHNVGFICFASMWCNSMKVKEFEQYNFSKGPTINIENWNYTSWSHTVHWSYKRKFVFAADPLKYLLAEQ